MDMKNKANGPVTIVLAGMLDTKGEEYRWMAKLVRYYGAVPLTLDLSLGAEAPWADIPLSHVLEITGKKPEDVFALSRAEAVEIVSEAGRKMIHILHEEGKVDGIIAWTGSIGATVSSAVMRELPVEVPKMLLSTSASGDVRRWLGLSNILIGSPISEKGENLVTAKTVGTAVAGIVAMAAAQKRNPPPIGKENPLAGISLYGVTTATAIRCADFLKLRGWDSLFFHQTGLGAVMEDLIRQGDIKAVFDLTPAELVSNYFHSRNRNPDDWKGKRFTAAFETGIPAVISTGAMENSPYGSWEMLPEKIKSEFADGIRVSYKNSGKPYFHSPQTLIIPTTLEENRYFARQMVREINKSKGPVMLLVPMQGWSAYDQNENHASRENGWAEGGNAPMWIGDRERPDWSKRAVDFWEIAETELDFENKNVDALKLDMHFLDPEFSEIACRIMGDMLDGIWKPGKYREEEKVLNKN